MTRFSFPIAATLMLTAASAQATQQGQGILSNWKQMDVCTKQAQAAYPEYNSETNSKRDAKLKECLNLNGFPPRQPFAQPQSR